MPDLSLSGSGTVVASSYILSDRPPSGIFRTINPFALRMAKIP